jgi:hypothetical protein
MPCIDDRPIPSDPIIHENRQMVAVLCGLLKTIDPAFLPSVLDTMNWKEIGVARKVFEAWHDEHRRADEARMARENAALSNNAKRDAALSKLTDEEKTLLGLDKSLIMRI